VFVRDALPGAVPGPQLGHERGHIGSECAGIGGNSIRSGGALDGRPL
jgi:hypothetical protein